MESLPSKDEIEDAKSDSRLADILSNDSIDSWIGIQEYAKELLAQNEYEKAWKVLLQDNN